MQALKFHRCVWDAVQALPSLRSLSPHLSRAPLLLDPLPHPKIPTAAAGRLFSCRKDTLLSCMFSCALCKERGFFYTLTILKGLIRKGGSCKQDTQRHKPSRQTQWRQRWERNFVTDANWRAVKILQVTWDFVTDVEANAQVLDIGGGVDEIANWWRSMQGKTIREEKRRNSQKRVHKGPRGVNQGWSVCLSDPTLRLVTAVCLSSSHTLS